ncbi:MAG TPA: NADH-quinone oxidoreductase subunit C [Angustibacter sp.]|nr:NADH-quinone oxidoreductase subunit C [Angustibacter sp.]
MSPAIGEPDLVARRLASAMGFDGELAAEDANGVVCVDVPREQWHDAMLAARDAMGLDYFDWLSAVDEPAADPASLDVVAHVVVSQSGGEGIGESAGLVRLLLRTRLPADDAVLASVTDVWPGAAWHERETYEMFGVAFAGFDDGQRAIDGEPLGLRPLLLPDGFEGTPLRKSFVLAARASKPWPGAKEPGESDTAASPSRRKMLPPGVPDAEWGPREPGAAVQGAAQSGDADGAGDA